MDWVQAALDVDRAIPPAYKWIQEQFSLKSMDRIRFRTQLRPDPMATVKLKLYVEITNDRSSPVVLSSAYFTFNEPSAFRHDPHIPGDTVSSRYHSKFLNDEGNAHSEFSYLLRPGKSTTSYISLDPSHAENDIQNMLNHRKLGIFNVYITWWTDREAPKARLVKVELSWLARRIITPDETPFRGGDQAAVQGCGVLGG